LAPIIGRHSIQRSCGHIYSTLIGKFLRQRTEKKGAVANCVGGHLLEFILCPFLSQGLSKHHTSTSRLGKQRKKSSAALVAKSLFQLWHARQRRLCKLQYQCKITATRRAHCASMCARERGAFFPERLILDEKDEAKAVCSSQRRYFAPPLK